MQRSEQKNSPENSEQSESITATAISVVHGATGPRTELGKEKSKQNALKHGIFSSTVLLKDEQRAKFDSLLNGLRDDLEPQGTLEEILVDKLASLLMASSSTDGCDCGGRTASKENRFYHRTRS
jgi:hypothetical protein